MQSIIVVTGPTGSGKSALSLGLASALQGEIVNADSIQVYKHFDIGSAKPSLEDQTRVPHHLVSILEPEQDFDVGTFVRKADCVIDEIINRKKIPIIVGGTGLYIQALVAGIAHIGAISEQAKGQLEEIEKRICSEKSEMSIALHRYLAQIDTTAAESLSPRDLPRIRRAILVKLSTGNSIKAIQREHFFGERRYQALIFVVCPERELLYTRINERVDEMVNAGFLEEVRTLKENFSLGCKGFGSIGYSHALKYLNGECSYSQMLDELKQDTRRYAKRQMTWWRNQPNKLAWQMWPHEEYDELLDDKAGALAQCKRMAKAFMEKESASKEETIFFRLLHIRNSQD